MASSSEGAYRRAAQAVREAAQQNSSRSFVFSSAIEGEGTTTTALNVARKLIADHGLKPLLIELGGDRPSLARWLELDSSLGVGAVASGTCTPAEAIQKDESGLHVIVSDGEGGGTGVHFMTAALERILRETETSHDVILIDAPPILAAPSINSVLSIVPRVILVVESGRTPQETLKRVASSLSEQNVDVVAAILNRHKRYIPNFVYKRLTGREG